MSIEKLKQLPKQYIEISGKKLTELTTGKFYVGTGEVKNNDILTRILELYHYCYPSDTSLKYFDSFIEELNTIELEEKELGELDDELLSKFSNIANRAKYSFVSLKRVKNRGLVKVCYYNAIIFAEFIFKKTGKWPDRDFLVESIVNRDSADRVGWAINASQAKLRGIDLQYKKDQVNLDFLIGEAPKITPAEADL